MDWITHTASALAGGLAILLPIGFWAWRQKNSIASQEAKDAYDMEKLRKSDFGKELAFIISELKTNSLEQDKKIDAQAKQLVTLNEDNLACAKKSAMQDIEIYRQASIITFLESRVKHLEESALPTVSAAAAAAAAAAAILVIEKKAVDVAIKLEETALANVVVADNEAQRGHDENAAKIERLRIHDINDKKQAALFRKELDNLLDKNSGVIEPVKVMIVPVKDSLPVKVDKDNT